MNGEFSGNEFLELIEKCLVSDRSAQKRLYSDLYGFAMSVCLRYCKTKEEAQEVLNNGFLKVFKNLDKYVTSQSFKNWFKRILINASIDFYRSQKKHYYHQDINTAYTLHSESSSADSKLKQEDLMQLVNSLPLAYKTNFCLFAIDGFSHGEISKQLGISVGTSKSNVSRARKMLRTKLEASSVGMNIV